MIGLKCPKCQAVMKVDEEQAGPVSSCPGCVFNFRAGRKDFSSIQAAVGQTNRYPNQSRQAAVRPVGSSGRSWTQCAAA